MEFEGQVFFRFGERGVWEFYRFARALAESGADVALEWTPMPGEGAAGQAFLGLERPQDRGRFLHAMLGLIHLEGRAADEADTVTAALAAAGVSPSLVADGVEQEIARQVDDLSVEDVPAIYRHGPVVHVALNGAALTGDVQARATTIMAMLDDDGIWGLTKP